MAEFDVVDLSDDRHRCDPDCTHPDEPDAVEVPRWRWLASTLDLQRTAFGWDWDAIRQQDDYPEVLARSLAENALAAHVELDEAMAEVGWKSWTTKRGWVNREAFLTEVVDEQHFIANMLVAVGITDAEYEAAYQAKQQVNRDRMASGTYDGIKDKCPACKRAYTRADRHTDGAIMLKLTDADCHLLPTGDWTCPVDRAYGADERLAFGAMGTDDA